MTQYPDPNQPPPARQEKKRLTFSVGQVIGLLIVIVLIVFIVENTARVDVRLIGPVVKDVPLAVALLIAAVLGALFTLLITWRRSRHKGN